MSRQGSIPEQAPPNEDSNEPAGTASGAETGELSFDDLPLAKPAGPPDSPFVHKLRERVEAALQEPPPDADAEGATDIDADAVDRWPPPVQFLCVMGGSALGWAVILSPFLIF